jgi:ribonuclease Z
MTNLRLLGLLLASVVAIVSWIATCAAWRADRVMAGVVPLEPRDFASLTLVTLGTGGAWENPSRLGPELAVALGREVLLLDAGRGAAEALRAAKLPVAQPSAVYLSNLMAENTVGLDDLLLTGWLEGRELPLRVVGPPGTRELAAHVEAAHAAAVSARAAALGLPPAGARLEALEVSGGFRETRGGIALRAEELPGGPLATLAWRFEAGGHSLALAPTGGWAPEAVVALARGADVLVLEAAFVPTPEVAKQLGLDIAPERLQGEGALHTSIDAVGGLARGAGVRTLVLVRLRPPPVFSLQITRVVDQTFDGRIVVADDGAEITP